MRRFPSQWLVGVAAVALMALTTSAWAQVLPGGPPKGTRIQGRVIRMQGPDRFVVRTADKREVLLQTNADTRFLLNNRAARFADIREGVTVDGTFDLVGGQNVINSVTITPAEGGQDVAEGTLIEGTVVRVLEPDNQLVVRTANGQEVIVFADDRTTFTFDDRPGRLVHFQPGTLVRAHVDVRDRKHFARSVVTMPKRPR
jgi:hypothetical protein